MLWYYRRVEEERRRKVHKKKVFECLRNDEEHDEGVNEEKRLRKFPTERSPHSRSVPFKFSIENHKVIPGETNFAFMEMLLHFTISLGFQLESQLSRLESRAHPNYFLYTHSYSSGL